MTTIDIVTSIIGAATITLLATLIVLLRTWYVVVRRSTMAAGPDEGVDLTGDFRYQEADD